MDELEALILEILNNTKLPKQKKRMNVKRNKDDVFESCIVGKVRCVRPGIGNTLEDSLITKKYPKLKQALFEYCKLIDPEHIFNAVCVNRSYRMAKHKDKNNVGDSIIVGIGDYTGGELRVYDSKGITYNDYNIKSNPILFNGAKLAHEVMPFEGERWTLVFYKMSLPYTKPLIIFDNNNKKQIL